MGIKQVLSAPRSPWQRAYVEPVIGTIRRDCLDHIIVFNRALFIPTPQKLRGLLPSQPHAFGPGEGLSEAPTGSNRQTLDASSPFRRSADCIIATSGALPEHTVSIRITPAVH
jgi:transposase InsO family protein